MMPYLRIHEGNHVHTRLNSTYCIYINNHTLRTLHSWPDIQSMTLFQLPEGSQGELLTLLPLFFHSQSH